MRQKRAKQLKRVAAKIKPDNIQATYKNLKRAYYDNKQVILKLLAREKI